MRNQFRIALVAAVTVAIGLSQTADAVTPLNAGIASGPVGQIGTYAVTPLNGGTASGPVIQLGHPLFSASTLHVSAGHSVWQESSVQGTVYDFTTSMVSHPPMLEAAQDFTDIDGTRMIYGRGGGYGVVVYDIATQSRVVIDDLPQHTAVYPTLGGSTVAWQASWSGSNQVYAADLSSPGNVVNISNSAALVQAPKVAPNGAAVIWDTCATLSGPCDVTRSTKTGATWGPPTSLSTTTNPSLGRPDTDGTFVTYPDKRGGATDSDIFIKRLTGGGETRLKIPGDQVSPAIDSGVITFQSNTAGLQSDIYVYVVASNLLLNVTDTPSTNEFQPDVAVLPTGQVRVVWMGANPSGGGLPFSRTFTLPVDATPPVIASTVTGTIGLNGWYTTDVGLHWTVNELESPASLFTGGCADQAVTTDQGPVQYSCTATSLGGTSGPVVVSIKRDATAPVAVFPRHPKIFTVDQNVTIPCVSVDSLSGIGIDCVGVDAPAYTFPVGLNRISSTAVDRAGNSSVATTAFTMVLAPPGLCALLDKFVRQSPRFMREIPRTVPGSKECVALANPALGGRATQRAWDEFIQNLARDGWITNAQAPILSTLFSKL